MQKRQKVGREIANNKIQSIKGNIDMRYTTDVKFSDKQLSDMETFQRVVDSIFKNVPDKYTVESVNRVAGENKVFVHIKPANHFAKVDRVLMEIKVE